MSFDNAKMQTLVRWLVLAGLLFVAAAANACLSDDTAVPKQGTGVPTFDAGSFPSFDGGAPSEDAGSDAGIVVDASTARDAAAPSDAGRDAASASQIGLVGGGTVGRSSNFKMTGTLGPATAPVLRSPKYQIVGGMSVTAKKP